MCAAELPHNPPLDAVVNPQRFLLDQLFSLQQVAFKKHNCPTRPQPTMPLKAK